MYFDSIIYFGFVFIFFFFAMANHVLNYVLFFFFVCYFINKNKKICMVSGGVFFRIFFFYYSADISNKNVFIFCGLILLNFHIFCSPYHLYEYILRIYLNNFCMKKKNRKFFAKKKCIKNVEVLSFITMIHNHN